MKYKSIVKRDYYGYLYCEHCGNDLPESEPTYCPYCDFDLDYTEIEEEASANA